MKIILVVGARPNFMKMAPLYFELTQEKDFETLIVHTGQHYDYEMSQAFFEDLDLPDPHYSLSVGSGTHSGQTGKVMIEFEQVLFKEKSDLVVVFGDVNSTLACSITAKKLGIPVAHVEAGLRSYDMTMPEEINRKLTDAISDFLFIPSIDAKDNLRKENIDSDKIYFVGNIMIDSLTEILGKVDESYENKLLQKFRLQCKKYALITLHRPSNVDNKDSLEKILDSLNNISQKLPVLFPMHPRTQRNIKEFGINPVFNKNFIVSEPLKYKEFIVLEKNAGFVLTDSGGIQEETTYFDVPCLTLRNNTERPVTILEGTNQLIDVAAVEEKVESVLTGNWKRGKIPELWDGKTAKRIVKTLKIIRDNPLILS